MCVVCEYILYTLYSIEYTVYCIHVRGEDAKEIIRIMHRSRTHIICKVSTKYLILITD